MEIWVGRSWFQSITGPVPASEIKVATDYDRSVVAQWLGPCLWY